MNFIFLISSVIATVIMTAMDCRGVFVELDPVLNSEIADDHEVRVMKKRADGIAKTFQMNGDSVVPSLDDLLNETENTRESRSSKKSLKREGKEKKHSLSASFSASYSSSSSKSHERNHHHGHKPKTLHQFHSHFADAKQHLIQRAFERH